MSKKKSIKEMSFKELMEAHKKLSKDIQDTQTKSEEHKKDLNDHLKQYAKLKGYADGGKLGSGERFDKLENKLSKEPGVTDPAALAASIGRKKYGNKKFNKLAHKSDGGTIDDEGQAQESQQKQYQAKDYFGKGSNGAGEGVANSMGIMMSEGGWSDLADKIREAFKSPPAAPQADETQDEKYARIRKENNERFIGRRETSESDDPDYQNSQTQYKADGGSILPTRQSMAQRISNPISKIDPTTGQVIQQVQKTYSNSQSSAPSVNGDELKNHEDVSNEYTLGGIKSRPDYQTKQTIDSNDVNDEIIHQIGQDFEDHPEQEHEIYNHYLKNGIDLEHSGIGDRLLEELKNRRLALDPDTNMYKKYADGGSVSPMNASANTASSLSPLLKESYAGKKKQKYSEGGDVKQEHNKRNLEILKRSLSKFLSEEEVEKLSSGGWAPEKLPKEIHPLGEPVIHNPPEHKYPLNIQKAPRITIPKRLKAISDIQGYADGGFTGNDPITGNIDPNSPEGLALIEQANYPQAQQMNEPENVLGDEQNIVGDLPNKPASEQDILDNQSPDDKALEEKLANEDFKAGEDADPTKEEKPTDRNIASENHVSKDEDIPDTIPYKDVKDEEAEESPKVASSGKSDDQLLKESDEEQPQGKVKGFDPIQALSDAKDRRDRIQLMNQLGAISERGAAQYAGIAPTQQEAYKNNMAIAQQSVDDVKERIAQQGDDPNSQISQQMRDYLAKYTGQAVSPDTTANTVKATLPMAFKDFEAKQDQETKKQLLEEKDKERTDQINASLQAKRDIAGENNDMKKFLASLSSKEKQSLNKEKADTKSAADQDKQLASTTQLLEQMRGSPAVGRAEQDIYAADKADSLMKLYGDPNKLSMPQIKLLASEVGKIATGGVPTVDELKGITPNTLVGQLSTVTQNLLNKPTAANASAFVKQYNDYIKPLRTDAQKVIKDRYGRIIESKKKLLGDDNYNTLKDQYLNRFEQQPEQSQETDPKIEQYAKQYNLDYNKAEAILRARGYK